MNNQPRGELVPGGLAMIVGSALPENIGKTVVLVSRISADQDVVYKQAYYKSGIARWEVKTPNGERSLSIPSFEGPIRQDSEGLCREVWLMPINPTADPLEITQQQEC